MNGIAVTAKCARLCFVFICVVFLSNTLYSQSKTDTLTSIVVKEVRKENASRNAKYSPGTRVQRFANISQATADNSLGDFLKKRTALYIKEYGRGMSSYLSMRGTSSSHTTIDWNGQSLSVPTLGQADLSHIPLYFFDNMSVHLGGNSALYGNGSISGNIQLKTTPTYKEGVHGDITLKAGSFATLFGGGTLRYGKNNWESRTSAYYSFAKNNYKFSNNSKIGHPRERLNNARYSNWGVLQELFHKFKDNSQLQLSAMHLDFNRQIQPSVSNNDVERSYHSILDRNTKVSANYNGNRTNWYYNAMASYAHDYELYEGDIIAADRLAAGGSAEFKTKELSIRGGGSAEYIKPNVHAYKAGTKEWRGELFLLALWQPVEALSIGGGLRGSFATDMNIPAQPSIDIKYKLIDSYSNRRNKKTLSAKSASNLTLRGSVSRSAKIPTLNDRYWGGISVELKPETGITYEIGSDYSLLYKSWKFNGYLTIYHSNVKDWIRWLPAGEVWRPQNVPKVRSLGVESGIGIVKKWFDWRMEMNANYNYTSVEMRKSLLKTDPSVGRQMAYQPKHTVNANVEAVYKKLSAGISYCYTGERTSTDIYDVMKGYSLVDLNVQYAFTIQKENFNISGELKNILNTNYQNVRFYAMPGINFALALQWKF